MKRAIVIFIMILAAVMKVSSQTEADFIVGLTADGEGVVIKGYTGNLSSINIPAFIEGMPVREIEGRGFQQPIFPRRVTNVVIPVGITKIGNYAFHGCSIVSVTIPEGVTEIGLSAFFECSNLTSIDLPKSLRKIGRLAFSRCRRLASVSLATGITAIESGTFEECSSLARIIIPEGVTRIGASAFEECTNLPEASLPSSIQVIGNRAFMSCTNLTTVTIPDSVQTVYTEAAANSLLEFAFRNCPKLNLATQARIRKLNVEFRP